MAMTTGTASTTQSDHIVSRYDEELATLAVRIAQMGGLAEQSLTNAIVALRTRDHELAEKVILTDQKIDAMETEVEDLAIQLIARRQPMASDLREVMAANKICSDLERIGDLAKNIAKRVGDHPRGISAAQDHHWASSISATSRCSSSKTFWMPIPAAMWKRPRMSGTGTAISTRSTPRSSANC
jgi:hypothetical protein